MKVLGLVVVITLAAASGCTKQNPNLCCTDEADCAAQGLSNDSQCADGLLCRGNQCIAVSCNTSNECDASAPYCVVSSCAETCVGDEQCPGFGQAMAPYCVAGACVQCRANVAADCGVAAPVCDGGACRGCKSHDECASGVCKVDGSCAADSDIAFVEPAGSNTTDCSRLQKCSLMHGISVGKPYLLLSNGNYSLSGTLIVAGAISLIGPTSSKPIVHNTTQGAIISIGTGADVTLENLELSGAIGTTLPYGNAITCPSTPAGSRHVLLKNVDLLNNAKSGLESAACIINAVRTTATGNQQYGFQMIDGTGTIEESTIANNGYDGIYADSGLFVIRNTFAFKNGRSGMQIFAMTGSTVEFSTIVDNTEFGLTCGVQGTPYPNNIVVRNAGGNVEAGCPITGSVVSSSVAGLNFKSPDATPLDYHITAGSSAIDAATASTINKDFDGDARPTGAGRDVGADEFVP